MTIEEMIAVMQAYEDGKEIEFKQKNGEDWGSCNPLWDWMHFDYRVKPEVKYVPYDSVSEVGRDKWIAIKGGERISRIIGVDKRFNKVQTIYAWYNLQELFEDFTYEDGTPCGKLVGT